MILHTLPSYSLLSVTRWSEKNITLLNLEENQVMSKSLSVLFLFVMFLFLFSGCSDNSQENTPLPPALNNENDAIITEGVETPSVTVVPGNEPAEEPIEDLHEPSSIPVLLASSTLIDNTNPIQTSTANTVPYVVKWGETLFSIARLCNTTVDAIMASNPEITSPKLIYAGQTLNIPTGDPSTLNDPPIGTINLTATAQSSSVVNLQWNNVELEDGYRIFLKLSDDQPWIELGIVSTGSIGVSIGDLQAATTYQFFVQVFNSWGTVESNVVSLTTPSNQEVQPPTGEINLAATAESSNVINLQWDNVQNEDGYRVYYRISGTSEWLEHVVVSAGIVNESIEGLQAITTYQFYIQAFNNAGSLDSNIVEQTTSNALLQPPNGTLNLVATEISSTDINLEWNDIEGEDGYRIFSKLPNDTTWQELGSVSANQTSAPIRDSQPRTTYQFYVQAYNEAGVNNSNIAEGTTLGGPNDNNKESLVGLEFYFLWRENNPLRPGSHEGQVWFVDNVKIVSLDRYESWGCSGYLTILNNWQPYNPHPGENFNWQDSGRWNLVILGDQKFRIDFTPEYFEPFSFEFDNGVLTGPIGKDVDRGSQGCPLF